MSSALLAIIIGGYTIRRGFFFSHNARVRHAGSLADDGHFFHGYFIRGCRDANRQGNFPNRSRAPSGSPVFRIETIDTGERAARRGSRFGTFERLLAHERERARIEHVVPARVERDRTAYFDIGSAARDDRFGSAACFLILNDGLHTTAARPFDRTGSNAMGQSKGGQKNPSPFRVLSPSV